MKLLQKLTFFLKGRRLPDEKRPDDITSEKVESGKLKGERCCDRDEPMKHENTCSVDGACCVMGEEKVESGKLKEERCCGDACDCEK